VLCGILCIVTSNSHGDNQALLQVRSQHAYNAVFGLPTVASRPVQDDRWQLSLEHSNQFMGGNVGDENLLLDGETSELTVRYDRRLAACWQGALSVPFVAHNPGEFDRAIDDWHQFFGLPDAERNTYPFDELTYSYAGAAGPAAAVHSAQSGIGDIRLSLQRSLNCGAGVAPDVQAVARIGIKLPTGSWTELRGSGNLDVYADIQSPLWRIGDRWHMAATAGLFYAGETQRFARQRHLAGFGALGTLFQLAPRYHLVLQLDWHTPFYDSLLRELGDTVVVLSTGIRYLAGARHTFELSISEDAAIDTAPDIVARLAWIYR
jgi:hypothetical protein